MWRKGKSHPKTQAAVLRGRVLILENSNTVGLLRRQQALHPKIEFVRHRGGPRSGARKSASPVDVGAPRHSVSRETAGCT